MNSKEKAKNINKVLARAAGLLLALALVLCLVMPVAGQGLPPNPPESFWGNVTLNGSPAPAGTVVSARVGGVEVASTTVDSQGRYGEKQAWLGTWSTTGSLVVSADYDGQTVQFFIGGSLPAGGATVAYGVFTELDLAATGTLQYTLTLSSSGNGNVTVPGMGSFPCAAGGSVTLAATAGTGSQFENWSGDVSTVGDVNAAETYVIMNGNYNITANFVAGPTPTPTPVVTPTPTPTPTPVLTTTGGGVTTPTPTPTATPEVTPTPVPTVTPILTPSPTIAPPTPTVTPPPTMGPTPTLAPTPTPTPAAGGKKTNVGVIIGPIIAVIVIAGVAYWFWRRRKPPVPPAPTGGSAGPTPPKP